MILDFSSYKVYTWLLVKLKFSIDRSDKEDASIKFVSIIMQLWIVKLLINISTWFPLLTVFNSSEIILAVSKIQFSKFMFSKSKMTYYYGIIIRSYDLK